VFVLVLLVPLVGLIGYLVVRGSTMQRHAEQQMEALGLPSPVNGRHRAPPTN
jgi:hypothetical protein